MMLKSQIRLASFVAFVAGVVTAWITIHEPDEVTQEHLLRVADVVRSSGDVGSCSLDGLVASGRLSHEDRMDGWSRPIALEQKDDGAWYVISRCCFPHHGLRLENSVLVKPGVERKESVSVRDVGG